mmetsp:Transcript_39742/g.44777  ORF Transcript_39742/g.44777 Transcript_39742/m.44777 type:complete len:375 (-) Transcript_39742:439-1563(-)
MVNREKMPTNNVALVQSPDQKVEQVVDLTNMVVGRIKPKPICVDINLKQQAMSSEELNKFIFLKESESTIPSSIPTGKSSSSDVGLQEISVVSSSSSTASRDSGTSVSSSCVGGVLYRKDESERINLKIKTQKISRNGRSSQRWYTDPATQRLYRMTTGCVPIVDDGKILFVTAGRKSEWILPKGGWEKDEAIEESAIRETFEEAGVFGVLGPTLKEIEYETRKAKKRRIEYEEVQRKAKQIRKVHSSSPKVISPTGEGVLPILDSSKEHVVSSSGGLPKAENEFTSRTQESQPKIQQHYYDACSVASETSLSYTHVKMSLIPLYVTEIRDKWPEQGRLRKLVNIDEAIRMTETRPEFQEALKELKKRSLHILK